MLRFIVLGLLRSGATYHGYALMIEYRERSGIALTSGNFYRELQRLAGEGLVQIASRPIAAGPRQTRYEISEAGIAVFDAWLLGPGPQMTVQWEDDVSARALFVAEVSEDAMDGILESWQSELWFQSKCLERSRQRALGSAAREPARLGVLPHLLSRRQKHVAADLEFVAQLRELCEAWKAMSRNNCRPQRRAGPPAVAWHEPPPELGRDGLSE